MTKKKPTTKKKPAAKTTARKRSSKKTKEPHVYVMPKTAAEHGITCLSPVSDSSCGKPAIWFDYELGEKNFYAGIVCDVHRVSNRVEKLAQPQIAIAVL